MVSKLSILPFEAKNGVGVNEPHTFQVLAQDGLGNPVAGAEVLAQFQGDNSNRFASQVAPLAFVEGDPFLGFTRGVTNAQGKVFFTFIGGTVSEIVTLTFMAFMATVTTKVVVGDEPNVK